METRVGEGTGAGRGVRAGGSGLAGVMRAGEGWPAQQIGVVLSRLVRDVDGAASDCARSSMHRRGGVVRLEHVPVGVADLAEEDRIVRDLREVDGVALRLGRVKVVGGAQHRRGAV